MGFCNFCAWTGDCHFWVGFREGWGAARRAVPTWRGFCNYCAWAGGGQFWWGVREGWGGARRAVPAWRGFCNFCAWTGDCHFWAGSERDGERRGAPSLLGGVSAISAHGPVIVIFGWVFENTRK